MSKQNEPKVFSVIKRQVIASPYNMLFVRACYYHIFAAFILRREKIKVLPHILFCVLSHKISDILHRGPLFYFRLHTFCVSLHCAVCNNSAPLTFRPGFLFLRFGNIQGFAGYILLQLPQKPVRKDIPRIFMRFHSKSLPRCRIHK